MKKIITVLIALWLSTSVEAQWVESYNKPTQCFCYAWNSTPPVFYAGCTSSIYKTTNEGGNWTLVHTFNQTVNCIIPPGATSVLFAGTSEGIYKTTNAGVNWSLVYSWPSLPVLSLYLVNDTTLLAGLSDGVYRSTNSGMNWDIPQLGGKRINNIDAVSGSSIYTSTSSGLYKTSNYGISWDPVAQTVQYNVNFFRRMGLNQNNQSVFVAGITGGYLYSTNTGANWYKMTQASVLSGEVLNNDNYLLGDTLGRVFHVSINSPTILWDKYVGLPSTPIHTLRKGTNFVLAGSYGISGQKIWRTSVSYVIAVKQISSEVPGKYTLAQNYPNPFNSQTEILYTIKNKSHVRLNVYDVVGKLVVTLVNEVHTPGVYSVSWNANEYSSGTYFYEISTSEYKETKRMVLTK